MSNNFPGGLIRKTPVTPAGPFQNGAAPGVWTLAEAAFWTKQGLWPIAGNEQLVVEDVFSTYLYTGNSGTQTVTNGIDLAGKGGLVWLKRRNNADSHILTDSARGFGATAGRLSSDSTGTPSTLGTLNITASSSGFSLVGAGGSFNFSGETYASWTFRKAPNFFDVVTYTGNGANRTIAHNLGVAPGMILVKRTDTAADWQVYHRSNANTQYMVLNDMAGVATGATRWNSTTPTSTEFSVGTDATVNASGGTYVAYLFAHVTTSDGIIQCGSYTGNGSATGPVITLGWEPQWLLFKRANSASGWYVIDNMRGMALTGNGNSLYPNLSGAENSYWAANFANINSTGFQIVNADGDINSSGSTYIYMAIRRGPMRTPTLGTSVFSPVVAVSGAQTTGFPVDMQLERLSDITSNTLAHDRLRGVVTTDSNSPSPALYTNTTNSEITGNNGSRNWNNTGFTVPNVFSGGNGIYWNFRRAPGFFDVVCYTGTGVVGRTVAHNLGVAPELMIVKGRNNAGTSWLVYAAPLGATQSLFLNLDYQTGTYPYWNSTTPTATVFTVGSSYDANSSGATYVAYLFASAPGVSKVGSYTGNGSSQTINCAFTTGARFVLIKRTDSTGDWYVWDSARGIVAGNDPYLALNTSAAEVTSNDSVDTDSTGFIVNQVAASNINVNAATYIFLAIA